jgi:hypothetical protein
MSLLLSQLGGVYFTGSGSLTSTPSTIAASGSLRFSGTGEITGSSYSISGSGTLSTAGFSGTGAIVSMASTISATGSVPVTDVPVAGGGAVKKYTWGNLSYIPPRPPIKQYVGLASIKSSASKASGIGFVRNRYSSAGSVHSAPAKVSSYGTMDSSNHDAMLIAMMLEM